MIIYGAGGLGREVLGHFRDDRRYSGGTLTLASDSELPPLAWPPKSFFIVAVGDPKTRKAMMERAEACGHRLVALVSGRASVGVAVGPGTIIMPGAVLTCDIKVGKGVLVNMGATIGHDTVLGDYCSVQPGACMTGNVRLEEGAYVGINATIINTKPSPHPARVLGAYSVVGGGCVVTKDVPPGVTVVGNPARFLGSKPPRPCPYACRSPHFDDRGCMHSCGRPDGHSGTCACEEICVRSGLEVA